MKILSIVLIIALSCLNTNATECSQLRDSVEFIKDSYYWTSMNNAAVQTIGTKEYLKRETIIKQTNENNCSKVQLNNVPKQNTKVLDDVTFYERFKKSIVIMDCVYRNGKQIIINPASGFVIAEEGIIVTNHHVADIENDPYYTIMVTDCEGNTYQVDEILSTDKHNDLAIIRVDTKGKKLIPLPLGESARVGQEVRVIAHPGKMFYLYTKGMVIRNYYNGYPGSDRMGISAEFGGGSSGSAVLDNKGNVIGIVSKTLPITSGANNTGMQQMIVKETIPVKYLKRLIDKS